MPSTPLRVTFTLSTPIVVPERPVHLDALLALAQYRIAERSGSADPVAESAALDSVIAKARAGDAWVWKASQLHFEYEGERFWHHYTRRFEVSRWADDKLRGLWTGNKNTINAGSGPMKSFSLQQPMSHVSCAVAWCMGDRDLVELLLRSEIFALGRSTRMGWGRIKEIVVESAPEGESEFWKRRTLPAAFAGERLPEHRLTTSTVHPPYWLRSGWQPAWEYAGASASVMPHHA